MGRIVSGWTRVVRIPQVWLLLARHRSVGNVAALVISPINALPRLPRGVAKEGENPKGEKVVRAKMGGKARGPVMCVAKWGTERLLARRERVDLLGRSMRPTYRHPPMEASSWVVSGEWGEC